MTTAVIISAKSFEFDGHPVAYSVTERTTGKLIGHVAKLRSTAYGTNRHMWSYLGVTEKRDGSQSWTLAGYSRADAVSHLLSWWAPSASFLAVETDPKANINSLQVERAGNVCPGHEPPISISMKAQQAIALRSSMKARY